MSDMRHWVAMISKSRPASVTISSYLLHLVAALQVVSVCMVVPATGTVMRHYKELYPDSDSDSSNSFMSAEDLRNFYSDGFLFAMTLTSAVTLIAAAGLVILSAFIKRGKDAARVVTLVLAGLYPWLYAGLFFVFGAGNAVSMGAPDDWDWSDERRAEHRQLLEDRFPSWYDPISTALPLLALCALLVALVLLVLPASNAFFRARRARQPW